MNKFFYMSQQKFLLFALLFSLGALAQTAQNNLEERQKNLFDRANTALKNEELQSAVIFYGTAYFMGDNKEITEISLKKRDSLKPIAQTELINKMTGNWRMIETRANWVIRDKSDSLVGKMITIEHDQILFFELYDKAKKWSLVKTEKINFSKREEYFYNPFYIIYSNKEVWHYYIDGTTGYLKTNYIGQETDEGIAEVVCGNPQFEYFKLEQN